MRLARTRRLRGLGPAFPGAPDVAKRLKAYARAAIAPEIEGALRKVFAAITAWAAVATIPTLL